MLPPLKIKCSLENHLDKIMTRLMRKIKLLKYMIIYITNVQEQIQRLRSQELAPILKAICKSELITHSY